MPIRPSRARRPIAAALLLVAGACAGSTGATFRSGVAPRTLEHPPYYAGAIVTAPTVAHLPIAYQRGAVQMERFDPAAGPGTAIAALLGEMNAFLDSLLGAAPLGAPRGTPPDVRFGCRTDASGDCDDSAPDASGATDARQLVLEVGRPGDDWIASVGQALGASGRDAAVVVTLEVGQYWTRQKGLRGTKQLELGTGHVVTFPWLTSLDTPVSVLQLTGALVGRDGRALRIGAEGILAHRTSMKVSALGAQSLLTDEDVAQARERRRDDLPGAPLAWQVALRTLVGELTGRPELRGP